MQIFISHIHEEGDLARSFQNAIRRDFLGLASVFCASDEGAINAGEQWAQKVKESLAEADAMFVLCSGASLHRRWIHMEVGAAWVSGKVIMPLVFAGLTEGYLGFPLDLFQVAEISDINGIRKVYGKIREIVKCDMPSEKCLYDLQYEVSSFEQAYIRKNITPRSYAEGVAKPFGGEYKTMLDGTLKQLNPVTGTAVWTVPGRGIRPQDFMESSSRRKLTQSIRDDTSKNCRFCEKNYLYTPPEKIRIYKDPFSGDYKSKVPATADEVMSGPVAEFRCVANLFEIVRYEYWRMNYDHSLPEGLCKRRDSYLDTAKGKNHINDIVKIKHEAEQSFGRIPDSTIIDGLFGGSHDLIISRKHYLEDARYTDDRCSSGDLSVEEHEQYFQITIDCLNEQLQNNQKIRYVAVFQNWLGQAGASIDHLHKQVVGIDERGLTIERSLAQCKSNRNFFNVEVLGAAISGNRVFAENNKAVALVEVGRRHPTIGIYSKAVHGPGQPGLQPADVRGMSDLVHACHAALGNRVSCNEEWYYNPPPRDGDRGHMPWYILLLLRTNITAGFEHSTRIFVNPLAPDELCKKMVNSLFKLRDDGKIANAIEISGECSATQDSLRYVSEH